MKKIYISIIKKDLKIIFSDKMVWLPMTLVPFALAVILPIALFLVANLAGDIKNSIESFPLFPEFTGMTKKEKMLNFFINYTFPSLFLIIPVLASSVIAGASFVGEKENKTIETLLYAPLTVKELFLAKVLGVLVPAYIITLSSFIAFSLVVIIEQVIAGIWIFPNVKWIIMILWLSPAVLIFTLIFMVRFSATSKTSQEAQQKIAFIIIPIIFLTVGQVTGLFLLYSVILLIAGAVIFTVDFMLLNISTENFTSEKLLIK